MQKNEYLHITITIKDNTRKLMANRVGPWMAEQRGLMDMRSGEYRFGQYDEVLARLSGGRDIEFPLAAFPRKPAADRFGRGYPPDQRVSWMASLLPYLDPPAEARYREVHQLINFEASWEDPANLEAGGVLVPHFLNKDSAPFYTHRLVKGRDHRLALTHFVGMAGVGHLAADYDLRDPDQRKLAGIFNNYHAVKFSDVTDGLSNTILAIQTNPELAGPWISGGGATVRGSSPQGDDVGSRFVSPPYKGKEGVFAVMADGSVRFIPKGIDPKVFKALCTFAGGEEEGRSEDFAVPRQELHRGGKGSSSEKPGLPVGGGTDWKVDAATLRQLDSEVRVGDWLIHPPPDHKLVADTKLPLELREWHGSPREKGGRSNLTMIAGVHPHPDMKTMETAFPKLVEMVLKDFLNEKHYPGLQMKFDPPEQGAISGVPFTRVRWKGTTSVTEEKLLGFIYVHADRNSIVVLFSVDLESQADDLRRAESAARSIRRK